MNNKYFCVKQDYCTVTNSTNVNKYSTIIIIVHFSSLLRKNLQPQTPARAYAYHGQLVYEHRQFASYENLVLSMVSITSSHAHQLCV